MEIYSTEEQQVEAIKSWFRENGNYVIGGIILGLGAVYGTSLYRDHQREALEQAATEFSTVTATLTSKGLDAKGDVESYIASHSGTTQALLAALQLAKVAADQGALDVAESQLALVLAGADKNDPLASIARLQLARVELTGKKLDEALTTLNQAPFPAAFSAQASELAGDIQLLRGDRAAAHAAYSQAVEAAGNNAAPTLREKMLDVADAAAPQA